MKNISKYYDTVAAVFFKEDKNHVPVFYFDF